MQWDCFLSQINSVRGHKGKGFSQNRTLISVQARSDFCKGIVQEGRKVQVRHSYLSWKIDSASYNTSWHVSQFKQYTSVWLPPPLDYCALVTDLCRKRDTPHLSYLEVSYAPATSCLCHLLRCTPCMLIWIVFRASWWPRRFSVL